ncbi:hypothetical protein EV191_102540 [Tamaricihabitans halophyticus]|uniref:Uncharacterized protein n=1 Tax=Tamaricihabitans halophyticus TaxID=1262583 RepID=A0A4R2R1F4_9PSEU|nr:hypothetical protein [Tamaricihabitans halophyticus]TCP55328.1 hypothetical protein EV191_102540 [Tamaricihabitans halophyticus]
MRARWSSWLPYAIPLAVVGIPAVILVLAYGDLDSDNTDDLADARVRRSRVTQCGRMTPRYPNGRVT